QSIFEGLKAYKFADGTVSMFRPDRNNERFNKSALRREMPEVPEEIFIGGLKARIDLDRDWVPDTAGASLYIRPFMPGTDAALGLQPSARYQFMILTAPVGAYYTRPLRLTVETHFTRAAEGGLGFSKHAGNYALPLHPPRLAQEEGLAQLMRT